MRYLFCVEITHLKVPGRAWKNVQISSFSDATLRCQPLELEETMSFSTSSRTTGSWVFPLLSSVVGNVKLAVPSSESASWWPETAKNRSWKLAIPKRKGSIFQPSIFRVLHVAGFVSGRIKNTNFQGNLGLSYGTFPQIPREPNMHFAPPSYIVIHFLREKSAELPTAKKIGIKALLEKCPKLMVKFKFKTYKIMIPYHIIPYHNYHIIPYHNMQMISYHTSKSYLIKYLWYNPQSSYHAAMLP